MRAFLAPALALLVPVAAIAAPPAPGLRAQLDALRRDDARLLTIGWRLASANAAFCADTAPAIGLTLLDTASFADPGAVRTALGMTGAIAVGAVAAGSPTERAGLRVGDEVRAIAGLPAEAAPAQARDWQRLAGLHDRIDAALTADGAVTLDTGRAVAVPAEPVCRGRFEVVDGTGDTASEGFRIVIDRKVLAALPDDDEAAFIVAHELAHNILRHRLRLRASGRTVGAIRATEREADRLAPWLMANAGYDPRAAQRVALGWIRRKDGGPFHAPTHDGWRDRAALIAAEIAAIAAVPARPLDWRPRFPQTR